MLSNKWVSARRSLVGLYLSDLEYNDTRHVFATIGEGRDEAHLATMLSRLEPILATVEVPALAHPSG